MEAETVCYCLLAALALQLFQGTWGYVGPASLDSVKKRQATDPTIEVDPELTLVPEDIGTVKGCVTAGSDPVMVKVRTIDYCDIEEEEVACDGTDYSGLDVTVTLGPGERRCFAVNITDDAVAEWHEIFQILVEVGGQVEVLTITIIDNDAPTLEVQSNATVGEGIGSVEICAVGGNATVPVVLVATGHCTSYHACDEFDYISRNVSLTVGPGDRICSEVVILDDDIAESTEELTFCLESAETPHVLMDCIHLDIQDNDAPTITLQHSSQEVREDSGSVQVCITGGQAAVVTATLQTSSSCHLMGMDCVPATKDKDYMHILKELTITSGDTQCYPLTIIDDAETEVRETLRVGLWDFQSTGAYYDLIDVFIIDDDVICDPICENNGTCEYPGICVCDPGWTGGSCDKDIDECAKDNGGCTDKCSNLQGSYVCSCEDDKKKYLDEDKHTCNGSPVPVHTGIHGLLLAALCAVILQLYTI